MSDSPQKRYVRMVRHSSLQQKAGFFLLVAATLALAASLTTARERLAKNDSKTAALAGAENIELGSETVK